MIDERFYCFVEEDKRQVFPENAFHYVVNDMFTFSLIRTKLDGTSDHIHIGREHLVAVTSDHNKVMQWLMGDLETEDLTCDWNATQPDHEWMDLLRRASDEGVPITLKTWAKAAQIEIPTEEEIKEDVELRNQITELLAELVGDEDGDLFRIVTGTMATSSTLDVQEDDDPLTDTLVDSDEEQ